MCKFLKACHFEVTGPQKIFFDPSQRCRSGCRPNAPKTGPLADLPDFFLRQRIEELSGCIVTRYSDARLRTKGLPKACFDVCVPDLVFLPLRIILRKKPINDLPSVLVLSRKAEFAFKPKSPELKELLEDWETGVWFCWNMVRNGTELGASALWGKRMLLESSAKLTLTPEATTAPAAKTPQSHAASAFFPSLFDEGHPHHGRGRRDGARAIRCAEIRQSHFRQANRPQARRHVSAGLVLFRLLYRLAHD
jgi:hypothetical protein